MPLQVCHLARCTRKKRRHLITGISTSNEVPSNTFIRSGCSLNHVFTFQLSVLTLTGLRTTHIRHRPDPTSFSGLLPFHSDTLSWARCRGGMARVSLRHSGYFLKSGDVEHGLTIPFKGIQSPSLRASDCSQKCP